MKPLVFFVVSALILPSVAPAAATAADKPNILMIAVDDLRPQLGCYGQTHVHSPNIDRLAKQGVQFERAYCMVPTCGASRASLMTSIRPAPRRFVTHLAYAEKDAPGITTLNTYLKQHGYTTLSNGKILHHPEDSAAGWSEPAWRPGQPAAGVATPKTGANQRGRQANKANKANTGGRGAPYSISARSDDELGDGQVAQKTIADLQRLKQSGKPFFLAAGFFKPHLPFVAPQKYWDLYPAGSLQLPANYHRPENAPEEAIHRFGELRAYAGVPKQGPVSDEMARELIRGYHACVSFTDAQIGRVLDELERLDLADETIVILWGDHGWNLGEHTLWCKHCCFETSMRVPLIIRAPGVKGGVKTRGLTELIDVYPSLCELAGLPIPAHAQGRSFVPLLNDPAQPWKEQAIGRFMAGDTIRTESHRFTEYSAGGASARPSKPIARMLYDHRSDPGENINVSERPDSAGITRELTDRLRAGKGVDGDLSHQGAPAKSPL
ncbi:MAG: sulfatase [Planctomycetaceae bacterium]